VGGVSLFPQGVKPGEGAPQGGCGFSQEKDATAKKD